jgi:hypothetical protein
MDIIRSFFLLRREQRSSYQKALEEWREESVVPALIGVCNKRLRLSQRDMIATG